MDKVTLKVSYPPYSRSKDSIERIMYIVAIALLPATISSIYFFGLRALWLTIFSIASCVIFEGIINKIRKKPLTCFDGSAIVTGLLLALNVPSSLPYAMVILGAFVAIVITKELFGGLGANLFNPALVARVFLLISFPVAMTHWPSTISHNKYNTIDCQKAFLQNLPESHKCKEAFVKNKNKKPAAVKVDEKSGASPLGLLKTKGPKALISFSLYKAFWGEIRGSIGETSAFALILGAIILLLFKCITFTIPLSFIGTTFVFTGIFYLMDPLSYASPFFHIFTGGLLLGAFFMATDMVTSPLALRGQLIFGIGCGLLTAIIRLFGGYPEGVSFAILIMNAFVPLLDRWDLKGKQRRLE